MILEDTGRGSFILNSPFSLEVILVIPKASNLSLPLIMFAEKEPEIEFTASGNTLI